MDERPSACTLLPPDFVRALARAHPFPDPRRAGSSGLLCYGGDLAPERVLAAYAQGVFPWYDEAPILWHSPTPRTVLLPAELRIGRTLRKNLRRRRYEIRMDSAFERVIRACAEVARPGQAGTWITPEMMEAYCAIFERGLAHSCEAWQDGELVGGIYGVSLGAAFFGESMFAHRSDASKVAFVHLVRQLEHWEFHFLDCQVPTPTTEALGARQWSRERYLRALEAALRVPTRCGRWRPVPDLV